MAMSFLRERPSLSLLTHEPYFPNLPTKKLGMDDLAAEEEGITSSRLQASDQALHDFFRDTFLTRTRDEWMKELEGFLKWGTDFLVAGRDVI